MNPLNLNEPLVSSTESNNMIYPENNNSSVVMDHSQELNNNLENKYSIVIVASGSRGDIQPYIALGLHLKARGHNIAIATEKRMQSLVEEFQLPYRCIDGDPCGILYEVNAQAALKNGSIFQLIKLTNDWNAQFNKIDIFNSYVNALQGFDMIISSGLTMTASFCIAEYYKVKWVPMILGPTLSTSEFPLWVMEKMILCNCLNKWSYSIAFSLLWSGEKADINSWRVNHLRLDPITYNLGIADVIDILKPPIIISYSPYLCPHQRVPFDYPYYVTMKGFVFVPPTNNEDISLELRNFFEYNDTKPIVYFGFGSMPAPNPLELMQLVVSCMKDCNCRGVLIAGWSELFSMTDKDKPNPLLQDLIENKQLYFAKAIPHDWLFPKVSLIIHHCGIGTCAQALKSGVPQIGCPFLLDQPHNAKKLVDFGVSPGTIPYNNYITAAKLCVLINKVLYKEKSYSQHAKAISEIIKKESHGALDSYCEEIEKYLAKK